MTDGSSKLVSDFGRNLRRAREARGWTQKVLALKVGVPYYNISNWETRGVVPSPDVISNLENHLDVVFLLSPEVEFVERNQLYKYYTDMSVFSSCDNSSPYIDLSLNHLAHVRGYVHYARLSNGFSHTAGVESFKDLFMFCDTSNFYQKLIEGLTHRRVEIFFTPNQLVRSLTFQIAYSLNQNLKFQIKFYQQPPRSIPTINLVSYDDQAFIIGSFHDKRELSNDCLYLQNKEPVRSFLQTYWDVLWHNDAAINLDPWTARLAADTLGIKGDEWKGMLARAYKAADDLLSRELPLLYPDAQGN